MKRTLDLVKLRDALLATLVSVIWGVNFIAINATLTSLPPLFSVGVRFILVSIPWVFFIKPPKVKWYIVASIGLLVSAGQFCLLYLALKLGLPTGLAPLVLQAQVLFTAIVAMLVLKEKPSARMWIGIGVGAVGLIVVGIGRAQIAPILPFLIVIAAALSWAIGNVVTRHAKAASGLSIVVWSGLIVPIPALILSFSFEGPEQIAQGITHLNLAAILGALFTAYVSTHLGYGLWNYLLGKYPAAAVGPYSLLIPVVGIASAWIVLHEVPSVSELVGGGILLLGVAAAAVRFGRFRRRN